MVFMDCFVSACNDTIPTHPAALAASYEDKNVMNLTAQLIKVVVIRPHPVASADSHTL